MTVIFCYFKIRNFTIDLPKFLVKRCFFLNQDFNSPSKIVLLFNHFAFTKICKELKLQRETSDVKEFIEKVLKNAPKRKGGEKNGNYANDMINTTNLDVHRGNHFYGLILRQHEFISS